MKVPIAIILYLISCLPALSQSSSQWNGALNIDDLTLPTSEKNPHHHVRKEFVYWASKGQALGLAHQYDESNLCFEKAYLLKMDQRFKKQNQKEESYEDSHELVMLLYYKILNYLELGDTESALIECKRLDELIHPRFTNDVERELVREDPLVHIVMGIVFELNEEHDDAVISYRKAEQLLQVDYDGLFSKHVPEQIKERDLELSELPEPNMNGQSQHPFGQLLFIWNNGQSPKEIISGSDYKVKNIDGGSNSNNPRIVEFEDCLGNTLLSFYKFSKPLYEECDLVKDDKKIRCELLEDVTWYSVRVLQKRLRTNGVHVWHKGSNWCTVPGSVYFAIVPLTPGTNNFTFTAHGPAGISKQESFNYEGDGKTHFHMVTTMESLPVLVSGKKAAPIPLLWDPPK